MNSRYLGLLIVAATALALVAFLTHSPGGDRDMVVGTKVLAGLEDTLDQVNRLQLRSFGQSATLLRDESGWVVEERGQFPADFAKLSTFLRNLSKATHLERKTSRPDNFALLGVTGIEFEESKATLVTVDAARTFELVVGIASGSRDGRFVRKPDESQVWLTSDLGDVSADPANWIDGIVLNIDSEQIVRVSHTNDMGEVLSVVKSAETDGFVVENLPVGARLQYDTVADTLSRALTNLRVSDVRPRGETPFDEAHIALYELKSGSRIVIEAIDTNDEQWLRVNLEGESLPEGVDPDRLARFEFKVADYTYRQLTKGMADMIEATGEGAE